MKLFRNLDEQMRGVIKIVALYIFIVLGFCAVICLGSCKTTKVSIQDKTKTTQKEAISESFSQDTLNYKATTLNTEKSQANSLKLNNTKIVFSEEGGTYNAKTGEATGVVGVERNEQEKELQAKVTILTSVVEEQEGEITLLKDSISSLNKDADLQTEEETTYKSGWLWWIGAGFVLGVLFIVIGRRIPILNILLKWI